MRADSQDEQLLQRIKQRDQAALLALYQQYGILVYSLAMRIVGSTTLAEEITQDTFLEIWRWPDHWDPSKGRFSSRLLTVTRFTAIDRLRWEQRRTVRDVALEDVSDWPSRDRNGDDLWQDGLTLRLLLAQLPPEQSQAVELAFFQGLTHSQIADTLRIPIGTIKTRIRLGLQKLKQLWDASEP
jgi:RNA polymerase sigma-70 factor (ECF subfamily)